MAGIFWTELLLLFVVIGSIALLVWLRRFRNTRGDLVPEIERLRRQLVHMQDEIESLRDENQQLREDLARLEGRTPPAIPPQTGIKQSES